MDSLAVATVVLDVASSIVSRTAEKSHSVIRRRQMDVLGKRVLPRSSPAIVLCFFVSSRVVIPFPGSRTQLHLGRF